MRFSIRIYQSRRVDLTALTSQGHYRAGLDREDAGAVPATVGRLASHRERTRTMKSVLHTRTAIAVALLLGLTACGDTASPAEEDAPTAMR